MRMTAMRVLFFLSFVLMVGVLLQQCWQSKAASEKWLYFFGDSARDYADTVLGPGRDTEVPVPEELSGSDIVVFENFVTFSPKQNPELVLAFSPGAAPAGEAAGYWVDIGDSWYVRSNPSSDAQ